jgi:hypothetical protein
MATAATEQQLQQSMQQLQQSSVFWHLKMNVTASFKQLDHTRF